MAGPGMDTLGAPELIEGGGGGVWTEVGIVGCGGDLSSTGARGAGLSEGVGSGGA